MAQETCVVDFKAFYYVDIATALPARPWTSTTDWIAAGFTLVRQPDGDEGALWTWAYEAIDKRPAGTAMRTEQHFSSKGLDTITLRSYDSDDAAQTIAFPDLIHDGASLTGGGNTLYYRMVMLTDNNTYAAKKVSASGNIAVNHVNSEFGFTPYEFRCFEDSDSDPAGTANWIIDPLLS